MTSGGDLYVDVHGDTNHLVDDVERAGASAGTGFGSSFVKHWKPLAMVAVSSVGVELTGALTAAIPAAVGLGGALMGSVIAMQGVGSAMGEVMAKFEDGLTPAAQSFMDEFERAAPAFADFQNAMQESLFTEFAGSMTQFADEVLPGVQAGMSVLTGEVGKIGAKFVDMMATVDFESLLSGTATIVAGIGDSVVSLSEAFLGLTEAATPAGTMMADAMARGSASLRDMTAAAVESGALESFLTSATQGFLDLASNIGDMLPTLGMLFQAFSETSLLLVFTDLLAGLFMAVEPLMPLVVTLASAIGDLLAAAVGIVVPLFTALVEVVTPIVAAIMPTLVTVVGGVASAFVAMGGFIQDNMGVFEVVATVLLTVFMPVLVAMGVQALISAAKVVLSWVMQTAASAASMAAQLVTMVVLVAKYVWMGAQALVNAAKVVLSWVMQQAPMAVTIALAVVNFAIIVGGWIMMAVTAMINAVIVAAAWLIAFWPIALIVVAVIALIALIWIFWDEIKSALSKVWDFVKTVFQAMGDFIVGVWEWVKAAALAVWDWVTAKVQWFVDAVKNHFTEMWDAINGVWEAIKTAAGAAWDWISTKVEAVVDAVVGFVTGIKDKVVDALSSAATWLYNAGKDMINGLLNGAKSILNGIYNWVKTNLFDKITNAVKSLFGIGSPSKVMAGFGRDISEGMAEGIASGQSDVQKELDALVPSQRFASSSSYTLTGADVAPPQVRVYIGDTELRGIVRTEVRREDTGTAAVLLGGVR